MSLILVKVLVRRQRFEISKPLVLAKVLVQ